MYEIFEILVLWPFVALVQVAFSILWPRPSVRLRCMQWFCGTLALGAIVTFGVGLAVGWLERSIIAFAAGFGVAYILAMTAGVVGYLIERRELEIRRRADVRGSNKESTHV